MKNIVVLGAGYTGMLCAIRLARRTRRLGVTVTLVNPSARFTERLRMHQVAAGQELTDHQIPALLDGSGVTFLQGTATTIDPTAKTITVDGSHQLPYDRLVYALGSTTDATTAPGADEHAFTLDNPRTAQEFSVRLAELGTTQGTVTVCGGGLTGVEAAAEIAEAHPGLRVTLVSRGTVGAMMSPKARDYLHQALARLNVTIRTGSTVTKVLPDSIELSDGQSISSGLCLWTTGVKVAPLAANSGIAVDDRGLIIVNDHLQSESHPEIYAIGDAAAVRQAWGQVHGTCQSGLPAAAHAADTIARELHNKPAKRFRFGYFHQPVSIGRKDAVVQFTKADDSPRRWFLSGRSAVFYKETISGSPVKMYGLSKRMNVSASLSKGGKTTK